MQIRPSKRRCSGGLELKPQIMSLPGMLNFINVVNEDGYGYVIAVVESEEISNASQDNVQAIWAKFADHLAKPPVADRFMVLMNGSNR